jgi:hypothetical protein
MPTQLNSWRDQDVRVVLSAVSRLAEQTHAIVLLIIHLNKGQADQFLHRVSGSVGIVAAARSILCAAEDPGDATRSVLVHIKNNLGEKASTLCYRIERRQLASSGIVTSGISWLGEAAGVTAADLATASTPEQRSERSEAQDWLREALAAEPQRAETILREAKQAGLSEITLRRAKSDLSIKVSKVGGGRSGYWNWSLPIKKVKRSGEGKDDLSQNDDHLQSDTLKKCSHINNIAKDDQGDHQGHIDHLKEHLSPTDEREEIDLRVD